MPTSCPECGHELIKEDAKDVHYRCSYEGCPAKLIERLKHFVSRGAFNIDKVGEKLLVKLLNNGIIKDMSDIFHLKFDDIKSLERLGDKSARNTIDSIENAKEINFNKFIFSLGIKYVGEQTAKTLVNHFTDIEGLENSTYEELIDLSDIGEKVASAIIKFFQDEKELSIRNRIFESGVKIKYQQSNTGDLNVNFVGKNIAVTGTMESFKREDIKKIIESNGGKVSSSVSKNTDFIVIGRDAGSKLAKANELGVKVVDEDEFKNMVNF